MRSNVHVLVIPQNLTSLIYSPLFLDPTSRNLARMMSFFEQPDNNNALEGGETKQWKKLEP